MLHKDIVRPPNLIKELAALKKGTSILKVCGRHKIHKSVTVAVNISVYRQVANNVMSLFMRRTLNLTTIRCSAYPTAFLKFQFPVDSGKLPYLCRISISSAMTVRGLGHFIFTSTRMTKRNSFDVFKMYK